MNREIIKENGNAELIVGGHTLNEEQAHSYEIAVISTVTDDSGSELPLVVTEAQKDYTGDLIVHYGVEGETLSVVYASVAEVVADERSRTTGVLDIEAAAQDAVEVTHNVMEYLYEVGELDRKREIGKNGRLVFRDMALSERISKEVADRLDILFRIATRNIDTTRNLQDDHVLEQTIRTIKLITAKLSEERGDEIQIHRNSPIGAIDIELLKEAKDLYFSDQDGFDRVSNY